MKSLLNEDELLKVQISANKTNTALQNGSYSLSTRLWDVTQDLVEEVGEVIV